jgi:hypothetical protein
LISLANAQGSLKGLLAAVHCMITASDTLQDAISDINLAPLIQPLLTYEVDLPLNVLTQSSLGCMATCETRMLQKPCEY